MTKALSIRQPWAWAILHAGKDLENRSWKTLYRGPILLYASKILDHEGAKWMREQMGIIVPGNLDRGGIVGKAVIIDCVKESPSPWFFGEYGFVLDAIEPIQFYPCRGQLGLFDAPDQGVLL